MSHNLSNDRSVRNEQILREKNTHTKNGIKKYFRNNRNIKAAPVEFVCECSTLDCKENVKLSIDSYENAHQRKDRFTIAKGHEQSSIEKVVADKVDFYIVEKMQLSP